jgi:hypothetical protein
MIEDLLGRIESDTEFTTALETDTFAALENAGYHDLARTVAQERDRVSELIDRIYEDDVFRRAIEEDPTRTLGEWGLPEDAVEPLLELVGAPDDVLERAAADFEAHLGKKPATVAAMTAMLGALAFGQQASASTSPASKAPVASPAAKAQITHVATAPRTTSPIAHPATAPAATSPIAKPEIRQALAPAGWHFAGKPDAKWQSHILSILRAQGSLLR